jgi:ferredoxin
MKDDKAVAFCNPVPSGAEETCKQAAGDCPVSAINVEG